MTIWKPDITSRSGSRYLAIADAIADSVADGTLPDGTQLPPQRLLADHLGVSLGTITRAYGEAERRGLADGEVGRGTFIRTAGTTRPGNVPLWLPTPAAGDLIDLSMNLPPIGEGATLLADTLAQLSRSPDLTTLLYYRPSGGIDAHAAAGATWMGRLGFETTGDEIILTVGAQQGVLVSLMATSSPGDLVLTAPLTYAPLKQIAQNLDLRLHPLQMDAHGLLPEAIDTACRQTAARVLYCMPTLQTPTTVTMPTERRREIAAIARRHDLTIIEDDVFGFLPTRRPRPLTAFAPERSLLITSVSKSLAPGLRVGYLRTPETYRSMVRLAVHMSCWMPPPLMAEIARRWIADGTADKLNSWQRTEARARQRIANRVLGHLPHQTDPSGLHFWLQLPPAWRPDTFRLEAERRGVRILTSDVFTVGETPAPRAIRLCLGRETSRERLTSGLEKLAELLSGKAGAGTLVV